MSNNTSQKYVRKEWMHPEDMDLQNPSNHVLYLKHLKAYEHILPKTSHKHVLEIGCGSGYGNRLMATNASRISTVDIDIESLEFAKKHNPSPNVEYIQADVTEGIAIPDNTCDLCVCFQVIEHIEIKKIPAFIKEISRIVKPGGNIYFTTPNRKIRLYRFQKPSNKYHVTEYTNKQLKKLLSIYFLEVETFGLQAIDPLKQIEIKRSHKSFVYAFFIKPLKSILKKIGIEGPLLAKNVNKNTDTKSDRTDFITDNFWFDKNVPDDSIDLLAVCKNLDPI